jgi:hypothetical protein
MKSSGATLCVSGPGPITQKCLDSKDDASPEEVAKLIKYNPTIFQDQYDTLKTSIEKYCGQGAAKTYSFDTKDCQDLEARLKAISPPFDFKNQIACQAKVKANGQDITATLKSPSDELFGISTVSTDQWSTGRCNANYVLIDNSKADQAEPYSSCLYHQPLDGVKTETIAFDSPSVCNVIDTTAVNGVVVGQQTSMPTLVSNGPGTPRASTSAK